MLGMNDLKAGIFFIFEGQPFVVLESHHLKMQQRRPVMQTRIKNLINGKIIERNFQQSDKLEEADIQKKEVNFIYSHKNEYWFHHKGKPGERFILKKELLGDATKFLKPNTEIEALTFSDEVINITLPIKLDYKVTEAPPTIKGSTASGGVKQVTIETGAVINVPLFIEQGDMIRINTHTGEYAERVSKK
jgi:elongation factor P